MYKGALANLGLSVDPLTQNRYALAGGNPISYMEIDGHLAILDDIGDAIKDGVNKASETIKDGLNRAGDWLDKTTDQASKSTRDWLNSDIGKRVREVSKNASETIDGLYGLVDKGKKLNSIAGSWLGNKKLPRVFRQAGSWWLNRVAKDKGFQLAKKFTDSKVGKGLSRAVAGLSFGLDAAENYAQGDKALPALGKAGISTGGAILGAKVGALAGGALGSEVPIIGNAVGAVVGGVAGGIIGGLAGDAVVKKFEPQIDNALGSAQDWIGDQLGIG
jgi:hypothetical protein